MGIAAQAPVLLPLDRPRLRPAKDITLPVKIYNPRGVEMKDVTVKLTTEYPTVKIMNGSARLDRIASGEKAAVPVQLKLTSGDGYFEPARLNVTLTYDGGREAHHDVDVCS
jgi:hypothetical protein